MYKMQESNRNLWFQHCQQIQQNLKELQRHAPSDSVHRFSLFFAVIDLLAQFCSTSEMLSEFNRQLVN